MSHGQCNSKTKAAAWAQFIHRPPCSLVAPFSGLTWDSPHAKLFPMHSPLRVPLPRRLLPPTVDRQTALSSLLPLAGQAHTPPLTIHPHNRTRHAAPLCSTALQHLFPLPQQNLWGTRLCSLLPPALEQPLPQDRCGPGRSSTDERTFNKQNWWVRGSACAGLPSLLLLP